MSTVSKVQLENARLLKCIMYANMLCEVTIKSNQLSYANIIMSLSLFVIFIPFSEHQKNSGNNCRLRVRCRSV